LRMNKRMEAHQVEQISAGCLLHSHWKYPDSYNCLETAELDQKYSF